MYIYIYLAFILRLKDTARLKQNLDLLYERNSKTTSKFYLNFILNLEKTTHLEQNIDLICMKTFHKNLKI